MVGVVNILKLVGRFDVGSAIQNLALSKVLTFVRKDSRKTTSLSSTSYVNLMVWCMLFSLCRKLSSCALVLCQANKCHQCT